MLFIIVTKPKGISPNGRQLSIHGSRKSSQNRTLPFPLWTVLTSACQENTEASKVTFKGYLKLTFKKSYLKLTFKVETGNSCAKCQIYSLKLDSFNSNWIPLSTLSLKSRILILYVIISRQKPQFWSKLFYCHQNLLGVLSYVYFYLKPLEQASLSLVSSSYIPRQLMQCKQNSLKIYLHPNLSPALTVTEISPCRRVLLASRSVNQ